MEWGRVQDSTSAPLEDERVGVVGGSARSYTVGGLRKAFRLRVHQALYATNDLISRVATSHVLPLLSERS